MNKNRKNLLIFVGGIVFIVLAMFIVFISTRSEDIDVPAEDGIGLASNGRVKIVGGTEILSTVKSLDTYDNLGADMYVYAKSAYEKYISDPNSFIGFEVSSIEKTDDSINFSGRFGAQDNKIDVVVKLLNYGRINVTIVDTKTGYNIDEKLPSNSSRNQYIGTLPVDYSSYSVDYSTNSDRFLITLYDDSVEIKNSAINTVSTNIGGGDFSEREYTVIVPSWVQSGFEE